MSRFVVLTAEDGDSLTLSNDFSSSPHGLVDLRGWLDSPKVRMERTDRVGDGEFVGRRTAAAREITLVGFSEVDGGTEPGWRDRIVQIADGIASIAESDGSRTVAAAVVLADQVTFGGVRDGFVQWQLPLLAPDPYLYGAEHTATLTPAGTGAGLIYPLTYPLMYSSGTGQESASLTNAGNATAWPRFSVVGDFPSGFRVWVDGRCVEYPYATFPQSPVVVDMAGHVMVGGADQQAVLTRREWASVPRQSSAVVRFEPLQAASSGSCVVSLTDTYI